jgi:hypothetical protein
MTPRISVIAYLRKGQNIFVIPNTRKARVRNRTAARSGEDPTGNQTAASSATNRNQA